MTSEMRTLGTCTPFLSFALVCMTRLLNRANASAGSRIGEHHQFARAPKEFGKCVKAREIVRPWLGARESLCQSLKARMISKAFPIRIARNPVSPGETGINRQFKRIKGSISFTEDG